MEWVDGNIGSKVTMKYPAIYLMGEHAKGERCRSRSPAKASTRTPAPRWSTRRRTPHPSILSKSVARGGGRTSYRGLIQVNEGAPARSQRAVRRAPGRPGQPLRHLPYVDIREDDVSRWVTRPASRRSPTTSCST